MKRKESTMQSRYPYWSEWPRPEQRGAANPGDDGLRLLGPADRRLALSEAPDGVHLQKHHRPQVGLHAHANGGPRTRRLTVSRFSTAKPGKPVVNMKRMIKLSVLCGDWLPPLNCARMIAGM